MTPTARNVLYAKARFQFALKVPHALGAAFQETKRCNTDNHARMQAHLESLYICHGVQLGNITPVMPPSLNGGAMR